MHRIKPPESGAGDAEGIADELGRLAEAGISLCVFNVSPVEPETLAWVAQEVAPRLGTVGR